MVVENCPKIENLSIPEDMFDDLGYEESYFAPGGIHFLKLEDNTMGLKGKTAKVKYKKLKKKARTVSVSKVIKFCPKAKGTLVYKKTYGNKKISVNSKTGTVTLKKKMKRGTYTVKVKVRSLGSETVKKTGWKRSAAGMMVIALAKRKSITHGP
jgi:flagellar capping protein FliD